MQNKIVNEETHENVNNTVNSKRQWALFTYSHRKLKITTELLKQKNIALEIKNTVVNVLNELPRQNICHNSGICQLLCQTFLRK
jgi:fructosamine-3-kinase